MKNSVLYEICVLTSTVEEGRITEGKPETYQPAHRKTANTSASVKVVRPNNGPQNLLARSTAIFTLVAQVSCMRSFSEETAQLAPLQSFDSQAFVGDSNVPQEICNFVLALALIYNDCKNGIFSNLLLAEAKPDSQSPVSQSWGTYSGMKLHYVRLHCALIHELLNLITANQPTINHQFFGSVIRSLPSSVRLSWNSLVDASLLKANSTPLTKSLLMIRNKVSFHYDPKELYRGYRGHFFKSADSTEPAFVSRGSNMKGSRFYFADAAAEGYLQLQANNKQLTELINRLADITADLNQTIMLIVDRFIQKRGYAYKDYNECT